MLFFLEKKMYHRNDEVMWKRRNYYLKSIYMINKRIILNLIITFQESFLLHIWPTLNNMRQLTHN